MYKLTDGSTVLLIEDERSMSINTDVDSVEHRTYLAWVAAGNTPEPADVLPDPEPGDDAFYGEYLNMAQEVTADVAVQILIEVVRGLLPK